ncbi:SH3 domain-containing protein [Pseudomonas sp. F01002]|uniref:SH3 domain-containing protein n=1 Tax=Pseudomonas sp. F01002 TaxID=2555724 RepID=UPI00106AF7C0|nr:SH3 domain-containing protein [Pseudomonas sp. F01002]
MCFTKFGNLFQSFLRDTLILRAGPNKRSEELGRTKLGTRLEVKAERGSWIHVSVELNGDELEGWVYAQYTLKL